MDDLLPIPDRTRKRDGKYQDAARLYIHKRITNFAELARLVGLPNTVHLLRVKEQDHWDDFTAQVASSKISSVWGELAPLSGWSADSFERVKAERDRQVASLPWLQERVSEVQAVLPSLKVGSKDYSSAVSSLRVLSQMLADVSGLDRWLKMMELAARRSESSLPERSRETKGAVIDL